MVDIDGTQEANKDITGSRDAKASYRASMVDIDGTKVANKDTTASKRREGILTNRQALRARNSRIQK